MKSCPGCEFLIDDIEDVCEFCAADPGYATKLKGYTTKTVVGALADSDQGLGGSVGILERPVPSAVNWSETDVAPTDRILTDAKTEVRTSSGSGEAVELRRERKPIPVPVLALGGVVVVLAVVAASIMGYGPLAGPLAKLGLGHTRADVLPAEWAGYGTISEVFRVEMPVGADVVFEPLDPTGAVPGGLAGLRVEGNDGAWMMTSTSDLGLGAAGLAANDSDAGIADLASRFAAIRVPGEMTISRTKLLAVGHASDSVYVSEAKDGSTIETRQRVVLVGDKLIQMVTSGPSSAATELDQAHQRMIDSLKPAS
ncbi:MAG: hypothetical protein V9F03_16715 [Microthrixaceae bacterium]